MWDNHLEDKHTHYNCYNDRKRKKEQKMNSLDVRLFGHYYYYYYYSNLHLCKCNRTITTNIAVCCIERGKNVVEYNTTVTICTVSLCIFWSRYSFHAHISSFTQKFEHVFLFLYSNEEGIFCFRICELTNKKLPTCLPLWCCHIAPKNIQHWINECISPGPVHVPQCPDSNF